MQMIAELSPPPKRNEFFDRVSVSYYKDVRILKKMLSEWTGVCLHIITYNEHNVLTFSLLCH